MSAVALVEQPQPCDRYKLLSSLIIVVYGELAQTRILASKPPFWRRLAAIAQAALIERCLVAVGADTTEFVDWAISARGQLFLLQCFVDLRLEPRWLPDLVLPHQLKNEFGGRMWMAANNNTDAVTTAGWGHLLLDDVVGSLRRQINIPLVSLPGPLEGGFEGQREIPAGHQAEMRADLSAPVITASSFSALVNGSLLFRIPADLADTAADAIARADYRLDCGGSGCPLAHHQLPAPRQRNPRSRSDPRSDPQGPRHRRDPQQADPAALDVITQQCPSRRAQRLVPGRQGPCSRISQRHNLRDHDLHDRRAPGRLVSIHLKRRRTRFERRTAKRAASRPPRGAARIARLRQRTGLTPPAAAAAR